MSKKIIKTYITHGIKAIKEGDFQGGLQTLKEDPGAASPIRDYWLYYRGLALASLQRCDEAKPLFSELLAGYRESRFVNEAHHRFSSADCSLPVNSTLALPDCSLIGGENSEERAECFFTSRRYAKAKPLYQFLSMNEVGQKKKESLVRLSQVSARSQDFTTAIQANQMLIDEFSSTKEGDEALKKLAFLHQDAGRYRESLAYLEQLRNKATSSAERSSYDERIGWSYFRLGDFKNAVAAWDQGLEEKESAFLFYWKAKALKALKNTKESKTLFLKTIQNYPQSYYAVRALEQVKSASLTQQKYREWWPSSVHSLHWRNRKESQSTHPSLQKAVVLRDMGLEHDAEDELRFFRLSLKNKAPWTVMDLHQPKKSESSFTWSSRELLNEDDGYPMPQAGLTYALLKPQKKKKSAVGEVDPMLIYALMRQESRYRANVVSPVGAIGFLQIMPLTGKALADRAGWGAYEVAWLYDPLVNIQLSIQYMKELQAMFPQRWYAAAASYNAGEHVVKEWVRLRAEHPEEEFIEEIPYAETDNYVKKIYVNWKAYHSIYR